MNCFECSQTGVDAAAVALCHHCSVALCSAHVQIVDDPVRVVSAIVKTVELPVHARLALCGACRAALTQQDRRFDLQPA